MHEISAWYTDVSGYVRATADFIGADTDAFVIGFGAGLLLAQAHPEYAQAILQENRSIAAELPTEHKALDEAIVTSIEGLPTFAPIELTAGERRPQ